MATVPLGNGRIDPAIMLSRVSTKGKGFKKMACSECKRAYYIRTGEGRRVYKTCSTPCSITRQSRLQKKNLTVRRAEKKYIGIYFSQDEYAAIKHAARSTPTSRYIRSVVLKDALPAGKRGKRS